MLNIFHTYNIKIIPCVLEESWVPSWARRDAITLVIRSVSDTWVEDENGTSVDENTREFDLPV